MTMSTKKGDWEVKTTLGDMYLYTTKGNVQLGVTTQGNVIVGTTIGDVTVQTTSGNITLATALGKANLDGTTCHIGNLASAIYPLLRGDLVLAAWGAYNGMNLTALNAWQSAVQSLLQGLKGPPPPAAVPALVALLLTYYEALDKSVITPMVTANGTETGLMPAMISPLRMVD
jgi:hypothetical protein